MLNLVGTAGTQRHGWAVRTGRSFSLQSIHMHCHVDEGLIADLCGSTTRLGLLHRACLEADGTMSPTSTAPSLGREWQQPDETCTIVYSIIKALYRDYGGSAV